MTERAHVAALDGVRGLAILAVLAHHFSYGATELRAALGGPAPSSLGLALVRSFSWGWMGVDLFFVLSGYLITGILLDSRRSERYYGVFYTRRFLRLMPALVAFLAVALYLVPALDLLPLGETAKLDATRGWYWTYLTNVLIARHGFEATEPLSLGNLWSLAVEEQFYLVWPFIVARCATAERVGRLSVAIVVGALAIRVFGRLNPDAIYVLPFTRADSLAAGALVACAMRVPTWRQLLVRAWPVALGAGLAGVALVVGVQHNANWQQPLMRTIGLSALAAACAGFLAYAAIETPSWLAWRPLVLLGRVSYGAYLWHGAVVFLLALSFGGAIPLFIAWAIIGTAAPVFVSWRYIETPALRLKRRVRSRVHTELRATKV